MTSLRDNHVFTSPSSSVWETTAGFMRGAWNGFRHVTQATGEFIGSELYSFNHEGGFGATQTGQVLSRVYGFAQDEINTARTEGISHTLVAQSAKDVADFVRYAVTERSLAENLQGAQDFTSQGIQQTATYVSTHSGAEIGYDLGNFVGEQVPLLVLTDGAGTALKVGGEVLDSAGSLANNARRVIGDFVDGLGSGPTIGSPAAQAGKLDLRAFYASQDTGYVSQATQIAEVKTFQPLGVDTATINDYLDTQEGQNYLDALWAADPSASNPDIYVRALRQLATGSDLPEMQITTSPLVKVVPEGAGVNEYTPFFTTHEELNNVPEGMTLADYFGLPLKSEAPVYSIYQITPTQPTGVFINRISPTVELNGLIERSGGAAQYLVPNRSLWSDPVFIDTISN